MMTTTPFSELTKDSPILYLIADSTLLETATQIATIQSLLTAGVGMVQFRDKTSTAKIKQQTARTMSELCADYSVPLIINDDLELAKRVHAAGVHLGKQDTPIKHARSVLGEQAIIGASCYSSLELAQNASEEGADYVALGAVFPSTTKTDTSSIDLNTLCQYNKQITKPVCAIGGITTERVAKVARCGVAMVAVAAGILAQNEPLKACQTFIKLLRQNRE